MPDGEIFSGSTNNMTDISPHLFSAAKQFATCTAPGSNDVIIVAQVFDNRAENNGSTLDPRTISLDPGVASYIGDRAAMSGTLLDVAKIEADHNINTTCPLNGAVPNLALADYLDITRIDYNTAAGAAVDAHNVLATELGYDSASINFSPVTDLNDSERDIGSEWNLIARSLEGAINAAERDIDSFENLDGTNDVALMIDDARSSHQSLLNNGALFESGLDVSNEYDLAVRGADFSSQRPIDYNNLYQPEPEVIGGAASSGMSMGSSQ